MKNHYYLLTTVLLLPCITTTLAVKAINDTEKYPVCVADSDCEKKNLIGHACFQYFCYPWQEKATEVRFIYIIKTSENLSLSRLPHYFLMTSSFQRRNLF